MQKSTSKRAALLLIPVPAVVWADWISTLALRAKPLKIQRSLHCQRLVSLLSSAFLPKLLDRRDCEDLTECSIYGILKRIKLFSPGTSSFPLSSHVRPLKVYKGAVKEGASPPWAGLPQAGWASWPFTSASLHQSGFEAHSLALWTTLLERRKLSVCLGCDCLL